MNLIWFSILKKLKLLREHTPLINSTQGITGDNLCVCQKLHQRLLTVRTEESSLVPLIQVSNLTFPNKFRAGIPGPVFRPPSGPQQLLTISSLAGDAGEGLKVHHLFTHLFRRRKRGKQTFWDLYHWNWTPPSGADFMCVADYGDDHLFSALSSQSAILLWDFTFFQTRVSGPVWNLSFCQFWPSAVLLFRSRSCVRLRVREIKNTLKGRVVVVVGAGWLSHPALAGLTVTARIVIGGSPFKQKHWFTGGGPSLCGPAMKWTVSWKRLMKDFGVLPGGNWKEAPHPYRFHRPAVKTEGRVVPFTARGFNMVVLLLRGQAGAGASGGRLCFVGGSRQWRRRAERRRNVLTVDTLGSRGLRWLCICLSVCSFAPRRLPSVSVRPLSRHAELWEKSAPLSARQTTTSIVSIYFMAAHCKLMSDGEKRGCNKFGPMRRLSTSLRESLLISFNLAWQSRTGLG